MSVPPDLLAAIRAAPEATLLCSDVDGTLAGITERAEQTRADPEAVAALSRVAGLVGRVALITGRPAGVVLGMGAFADIAGLTVVGHYGLDRWEAGATVSPEPDPAVARARAALPPLPEGAYLEDKGLSFVVHTRPAADPAGALAALDEPLRALAAEHGLDVVDGSFAREFRPAGIDKGVVVAELAAGRRVVVYLGDDDGDLPAAAALRRLRERGVLTLLVCAARDGGSVVLREQADLVVDGVTGIAEWLTELAVALEAPASPEPN